ncbi:ABC transporter permease subunit [Pseudaminobacter sp. 19-2017]|uniref:ABC transporter permease subunit n=1 Tax=Pseudaminobacter soli (ex Zhang et al. 2022) TaxID=2831468 RepID=A0A942I495_9HYPH|nr:ABC transporter permease subunit [Pseudaminobacter soli]MBS3651573.1 ABC transporter permease subunit [Pseudaminobacter soli]
MTTFGDYQAPPFWRRPFFRRSAAQIAVVVGLLAVLSFFIGNASANLAKTSTTLGFGFIWSRASFELGEGITGFVAGDSVLAAFWAGIVNTLLVSLASIVTATVLGIAVGILRLSSNPLSRLLSSGYIELMRNIPLILQMLFWYAVITRSLPTPRKALSPIEGLYLTNRGVYFSVIQMPPSAFWALVALSVLLLATLAARATSRERTGSLGRLGDFRLAGAAVVAMLAVVLTTGSVDVPEIAGLNFKGGASITPEFTAVFLGLSIFSAAFIAENVRAGILGVSAGQKEAAASLGLRDGQTMRLVVLPQALKISVPPIASQYLDIVKNSSLAVAIAYPEIMRVATVVISEVGRSIEVIAIIMAVYLSISLAISALMNAYNKANLAKGT